jgi:uncharacterized protein YndB with AHSA1/START domain
MKSPETTAVSVSRRFSAPAEQVFDGWILPEQAGKWLFATPTGKIVRVEIDARVGGQFAIADQRNGEDVEHVGRYVEIDRPRRLVFEFAVPKYSPLFTRVTIDIAPREGGCELSLMCEDVLLEWAEPTRQGWTMLLGSLARIVEGT